MRRKINDFTRSLVHWESYYNFWFQRLYNMAVTGIKWENTHLFNPNGIQLPEKWLVRRGNAAIFEDEIMNRLICLPYTSLGKLNIYGEPSKVMAYGENGYKSRWLVPMEDCVIVRNNPQESGEMHNIDMYAKRLANSMITGDINLSVHKTPLLVTVDEERKWTVENLINEFMSGAAKIFGNKNIYKDDLQVLKLDAPYIVDKITENTLSIWNEWLNYLGVPSLIVQKKERQLADEVMQNMGGAIASRVPRLACREEAIKGLKNVFGIEAEISFAVDTTPAPDYRKEVQGESIGNFDGDNGRHSWD